MYDYHFIVKFQLDAILFQKYHLYARIFDIIYSIKS